MTTERMRVQRKRSTLVILSGVGAHATTQSKDLCIRCWRIRKRPRASGAKRHAGAEGLFSGVERSDRMFRTSAPNPAPQEQMTLKLERGLFSGVERSDRIYGQDVTR